METRFAPSELVTDRAVFGPALGRVRRALGVSQRELGQHALTASSTIATYETEARDPSVEALVGIAVACGVEPWSAAQHGHLLLQHLAMDRDSAGRPRLVGGMAAPGLPVAAGLVASPPAVVAVTAALTAAHLALAVRRRRAATRFAELADQKLLAKALAATPAPAAEAAGLYPLVEPRDRTALEADLAAAADSLSDDELTALVAALHAYKERSADDQ